MRKTIKSLALLLAIAVLLAMPVHAAEGNQITPRESTVMSQYCTYLYVPSGNTIQIWFELVGTRVLDRIGVLRVEIQRSFNGVAWTTMQTYEYTDYPTMMATDKLSHDSYVTHYGTYGYYYRAKVTIFGQKGSDIYTKTVYTDTIYLGS